MSKSKSIDLLQSLLHAEIQAVNELILYKDNTTLLLHDIAKYIVDAGGKRLRPLLTLAIWKLTSNTDRTDSNHIALATAVELIHTATLLHDDVIDSSLIRRNLPTANGIWGDKASILVGDNMFSKAFQLMVSTDSMHALQILADASAAISEAEVWQLQLLNNIEITIDDYINLIINKTAKLFAAACMMGAIVNNCDKFIISNIETFGLNLGICYQISDDLLDYIGDSQTLGKDPFQDIHEGKVTIPLIILLQRLKKYNKQIEIEFVVNLIGKEEILPSEKQKILKLFDEYHIVIAVQDFAKQYLQNCIESLQSLSTKSEITNLLMSLANEIVIREN